MDATGPCLRSAFHAITVLRQTSRQARILDLSGAATVEAAPPRADLKAAAPGPRLIVPRMRRSVERSGKVLGRRGA
jgi:hypothetical protein